MGSGFLGFKAKKLARSDEKHNLKVTGNNFSKIIALFI